MKNYVPAGTALALVLLAAPAAAQAVLGTNDLNSPASVRCSALGELEEEARAGAVQYLAGYGNGQRDAVNFATSGPSDLLSSDAPEAGVEGAAEAAGQAQQAQVDEEAAPAAEEQPAAEAEDSVTSSAPTAAVLPLVPVEAVLTACAQSPDSRVIDIIVAQGVVTNQ